MNLAKKLIIAVEGIDNTGKTTLIRRLEELLGISGHMSNGRPQTVLEMFNRMENYLLTPGVTIHDRLHCISDQIYGPVIRKQNHFLKEERGRQLFQSFKETPHLIIYCRPPREKILDFGSRDQMPGVITNAAKLLTGYDAFMRKLVNEGKCEIAIYDYTDQDSYIEIRQRIKEMLK